MTRIKICCIQSAVELELAAQAGAAAAGLVGPMPSGPGQLDDGTIRDLASQSPDGLMTVLLTSRTGRDKIIDQVRFCQPAAVQLVDQVEPGTAEALRDAFPGITVMQVIHVNGPQSLTEAAVAWESADMLLLDSGNPEAATRTLGGTGNTHDWSLSARIVATCPKPVWLAGGLNPGNVADAIRAVRPHGVDVCSGLRPSGVLDPALLAHFTAQVKAADNA